MFLIYRFLTILLYPIFVLLIYFRKLLNKEDNSRYKEKIFRLERSKNNKERKLIWFHGASIGEIASVKPVIKKILEENNKLNILITSNTFSSGKMIEKDFRENNNISHYYFPLDVPFLIQKFLNYWKPDLAIFIDSEIWPNYIFELKKRKVNLVLINGRITNKTFERWKFFKKFSNHLFSSFNVCFASSKDSFKKLKELGVKNLKYYGNLKFISTKKNDQKLDKSIINFFDKHEVWCAASTHEGDEMFCIKTHKKLKINYRNTLTIIIPRHITRIKKIFSKCKKNNISAQIFNEGDKIQEDTELLLINSFGALPKYYNYCKSVLMGKSTDRKLIKVAGQNPLEAIRAGCHVYHGPYVYNFQEIYDFLNSEKIASKVENIDQLVNRLEEDFKKPKNTYFEKINELEKYGSKILLNTTSELKKVINYEIF